MIWADHVPTKHFWAGRHPEGVRGAVGRSGRGHRGGGRGGAPGAGDGHGLRSPHASGPHPRRAGYVLRACGGGGAGLGTLGLNEMLLTPRFGPRCFVGAVLTELDLPPDEPLAGELCLGLEACGRCAAICPERAIPLRAPGAALAAVRGLDHAGCARSSQPYGPATMARHLTAALDATQPPERWRLVKDLTTGELWQQVTMHKEGGFTRLPGLRGNLPRWGRLRGNAAVTAPPGGLARWRPAQRRRRLGGRAVGRAAVALAGSAGRAPWPPAAGVDGVAPLTAPSPENCEENVDG